VSLNYSQTDNVPVFVDRNSTGMWDVLYSGTTKILSLDGELYARLSDADNLGASVSIRSNKNSSTGNRNPYFASFLSSASYQHRFAFGLTMGSALQIVGSRSVDLAGSRTLPAFVVLNLDAEYVVVPRWSLIVTLNDLLNQEQTMWEGYPGLQRTVSLGTSFVW
jgi:outer membrane cobalamin receptor